MDAKELRVGCAALNISYKELSELLGVSKSTVSRWIHSQARIPRSAEMIIRYLLDNAAEPVSSNRENEQ